jgi:hypothetical protein
LREPLVAGSGSQVAAVPEPTASCILAAGAMLCQLGRRTMRGCKLC